MGAFAPTVGAAGEPIDHMLDRLDGLRLARAVGGTVTREAFGDDSFAEFAGPL